MTNTIDHFAIGAASLDQGVVALEAMLGVTVPRGGKHAAMSTHNCVTQAGGESFLEILAIDPDAPNPDRTRWFTMDDPETRRRIAERPRTLCWVVATEDMDLTVANSPVDLGEIVHFSRGDRTWRLTVPKNGSLPEAGLIPAFIEWSPGPHPSSGMQDLGVRLSTVSLFHPEPDRLRDVLAALKVDHLTQVTAGQRELAFVLDTPRGSVVLN